MSPKRPGILVSLSLMLAAPGVALGQTPTALGAPAQKPTAGASSDPRVAREIVPSSPSRPPQLSREAPPLLFSCQRRFVWQGKELTCDSPQFRDAENLRPIVDAVPESELQLDAYQRTRRKVRNLAFVGAGGVLVVIGSFFLPKLHHNGKTRDLLQLTMLGVGSLTTVASFFYGLGALHGNEQKLQNTLDVYNRAKPETPIALVDPDNVNPHAGAIAAATGTAMLVAGLLIPTPRITQVSTRNLKKLLIGGGALVMYSSAFYSLGLELNDDLGQPKAMKLTMEFNF